MMPAGAAPGFVIAPVAVLKKVAPAPPHPPPACCGSQFGMMNGFTQRAITGGVAPAVTLVAFEGLKPSALAVARTVSAALLQMREKKVGRFVFCTVTLTCGLMGKLGAPEFGNVTVTSAA